MDQSQENDNFIDKTFSIMTDIFVKTLPLTKVEKEGFIYYRYGMNAQSKGKYGEALEYYYQALNVEEDPYDRSYILYNMGLIYASNAEFDRALEYYLQSIKLNKRLPQALNNIAVIYHYQGVKASEKKDLETARSMFDKAGEYWKQAIRLAPNNYIEAQNWLKTTGRSTQDSFN